MNFDVSYYSFSIESVQARIFLEKFRNQIFCSDNYFIVIIKRQPCFSTEAHSEWQQRLLIIVSWNALTTKKKIGDIVHVSLSSSV